MAARAKSVYRCTECGAEHPKWAGRCEACGEWNTLAEEAAPRPAKPPEVDGDLRIASFNLQAHPCEMAAAVRAA